MSLTAKVFLIRRVNVLPPSGNYDTFLFVDCYVPNQPRRDLQGLLFDDYDLHDEAVIPKSFTEAIYFCPGPIQKAAVPFRKPWSRFSRDAGALRPIRKTRSRRTVPRDEISI